MEPSKTSLSNSDPSTMSSDSPRQSWNSASASSLEMNPESSIKKSKKKNLVRKRTTYNHYQLQELYVHFQRSPYMDTLQIEKLSRRLGITHNQVRKWFQNMRMKIKKQISLQEFQFKENIPQMLHLSVMNSSSTQGATQPSVTWQQHSGIYNFSHPEKRDNQSWTSFSHEQQKTVEFTNGHFHQETVPTYSSPHGNPYSFQSNYGMDRSGNLYSYQNMQQQTDTRIQQVGSFDNFMTTLRTTQGNIQNSWNFDTVINPQP